MDRSFESAQRFECLDEFLDVHAEIDCMSTERTGTAARFDSQLRNHVVDAGASENVAVLQRD